MFYPTDRLYSHRHLWVRRNDETGQTVDVGITDFLQERLPEIESIDLPMVGDELEMDTPCGLMHLSTSRLRRIFAPLTGRVTELNRDVLDRPSLLHLQPYDAWLFRMEFDEPDELEMLMSAERYERHIDRL